MDLLPRTSLPCYGAATPYARAHFEQLAPRPNVWTAAFARPQRDAL
jgi:hypothetical protein